MLSADDKVALLRELTKGPSDVYALRAERWQPVYAGVTDALLKLHMAGYLEVGAYPLIPTAPSPTVWWIGADFDGKRPGALWQNDVKRAVQFLLQSGCTLFINLSRSGFGAHVRVLFAEAVPAWLARRFMTAWLEEAGVAKDPDEWDDEVPPSFDRIIPPQDFLSGRTNDHGQRLPGNLLGSPLHAGHAKRNGGTLPLRPLDVAVGDFVPKGDHWDIVTETLASRNWNTNALYRAVEDAPGSPGCIPPVNRRVYLPLQNDGTGNGLWFMLNFCEFFKHMREPGLQPYDLWVAAAAILHHHGQHGHEAFHEISAFDPRYDPSMTEHKWEGTDGMHPLRCRTLIGAGYRCPHLDTPRCGGAITPVQLYEYSYFNDEVFSK